MDAMVSARVPVEVRDQVNEGLRSIGSSPTELINSAYQFFLEQKKLPQEETPMNNGRRVLSEKQRATLKASVAATTYAVPESYFKGRSYDEMLGRRLRHGYEALA